MAEEVLENKKDEKVLTENEKAIKDIRRKHVIGWSLGTGLVTLFTIAALAVAPWLGAGYENVLTNMLNSLPDAGEGLILGAGIGAGVGAALAHNKKHVEKHINEVNKKAALAKEKEDKRQAEKAKQEEEKKKNQAEKERLAKEKEEKRKAERLAREKAAKKVASKKAENNEDKVAEESGNVIKIIDFEGNIERTFLEVPEKDVSLGEGKFSSKMQLAAVMAKYMPDHEVLVELNGETVGEYHPYDGDGTPQTKLNESTKMWKGVISELSENLYHEEEKTL